MKNLHFNLLPEEHVLGGISRSFLCLPSPSIESSKRKFTGRNEAFNLVPPLHKAGMELLEGIPDKVDKEQLLLKNSLIGFFSHSLKYRVRAGLVSESESGKIFPFIDFQTKLKATESWRWCPKCVREDQQNFGISYWHTAHQLPTSVTCYKHPELSLIDKCEACGFAVTDLSEHSIPFIKCPKCNHINDCSEAQLHSDLFWIQEKGLELHRGALELETPRFEYDMSYALALFYNTIEPGTPLQRVLKMENYQNKLDAWIRQRNINLLFRENVNFTNDLAINLERTINKPRKVTPLSHLIWLRFFGMERLGEIR